MSKVLLGQEQTEAEKAKTTTAADKFPAELQSLVLEHIDEQIPPAAPVLKAASDIDTQQAIPADAAAAPTVMAEPVKPTAALATLVSAAAAAPAGAEEDAKTNPDQSRYKERLSFLAKVETLYNKQATEIAHNLAWCKNVENTLKFAKENPHLLNEVVEIKDPNGQRIRGKILQIVATLGDRNPRPLNKGEKDYGLVERLRPCFPNQETYDAQLKEWFGEGSKDATKERTNRIIDAVKVLCKDIIEDKKKEISEDVPYANLLKLEMAEKFRQAVLPDPNKVVTSGLVYDFQVFLDFFAEWKSNVKKGRAKDDKSPHLGEWWDLKSDLFGDIVYLVLQKLSPRCDWGMFKLGIGNAVDQKQSLPNRVDFSHGAPKEFKDFGDSFLFGFFGHKIALTRRSGCDGSTGRAETYSAVFQNLCRAKMLALELCSNRNEFTPRVGAP